MWKFLKAGYLEDWVFHKTYSGTPQGGIISPILSNIYLDKLDKFVEKLQQNFDKGAKRRPNTEYRKIQTRIYRKRKELKQNWDKLSAEQKDEIRKYIREQDKILRTLPSKDPMDPNFKRLKYFRYADDFVIGIIGSKQDAQRIKEEIAKFLREELKLTLSEEKTLITHAEKPVRFLGYDIKVRRTQEYKTMADRRVQRRLSEHTALLLPHEKVRDFLLATGCMKIEKDGRWKAIPRKDLLNNDDLEILLTYNAELRGFYNYYDIASNVHKLGHAAHVVQTSFLKTLGTKYRTKMSDILRSKKYNKNGVLGVAYIHKEEEKFHEFYNKGFRRKRYVKAKHQDDKKPQLVRNGFRTSLMERLKANQCEWCQTTEGKMEVHHVRKLKGLSGKKSWEKVMIARRRKTMVLCKECHGKLHRGELD
jgi:hypothetical protein